MAIPLSQYNLTGQRERIQHAFLNRHAKRLCQRVSIEGELYAVPLAQLVGRFDAVRLVIDDDRAVLLQEHAVRDALDRRFPAVCKQRAVRAKLPFAGFRQKTQLPSDLFSRKNTRGQPRGKERAHAVRADRIRLLP